MRLLIIGAMDGQIGAASQIAMARGAKVSIAEDVDQGMEVLRSQGADLVMIDVRRDVTRLIECLEAERIVLPVIACGIASDASAAVRAIKAGAKEYIPLPPDAELIAAVLAAVTDENHAIVYKDPRMTQTMKLAEQVANSHASILVTGESGTGKELMARFIHNKSPRAKGRFVAVNCAAIPENLLESELFGHEKGAFTGAVARRIGKFEEANGGTLLLDEISEMDIRLQAKLLRAVQEREIDRVGGTQPVKIDVRIVATSNRNLAGCGKRRVRAPFPRRSEAFSGVDEG
ncbi:sigma-54-dependent transcriptional regulator, partial [Magnetospirillum sulfuroxidans]